ncbi:MAG: universal stress protein [Anaerolineae bacterium]|nr:universal stress protein [Anaerolineae bacterium]
MYKNILLTLDGSALAEQAFSHAAALAQTFAANLHLVRVVVPFNMLMPTTIEYDLTESYRRDALHEAHQYLHEIEQRARHLGVNRVQTKVVEGVVVDAILDYANFHGVDLVVMATHGRSGLGRWVFGSVAERVLHAANVPVMLIRAQLGIPGPDEARVATQQER